MEVTRIWSPLHSPVYFDHITWLALLIVLSISVIIIIKLGERC